MGNRKLALVGIIPNQILFSFSSDKDRRTDSKFIGKFKKPPFQHNNAFFVNRKEWLQVMSIGDDKMLQFIESQTSRFKK